MGTPPRDPPRGSRFSLVYLERGEPRSDSTRMRRRIAAELWEIESLRDGLWSAARRELGIEIPYPTNWINFLEGAALRDVLDLVTVAAHLLKHNDFRQRQWLMTIQRIFREENVHYRVDPEGGVHFHFDQEFATTRAAAVQALQADRYANALHAFEGGMASLSETPPNGKGGIRGVFAATESIFRLIVPGAPRLGAAELDGLGSIIQRVYAQEDTARRSASKMLSSLKDWVDAAHFYRHEEGSEEIAQPPLRLAVYIVSTGASHLRWLAELDTALQANPQP